MKPADWQRAQSYHQSLTADYGLGTARSVGWVDAQDQYRRFEVLVQLADLNHCQVLDAGCAYADMKLFLDQHFSGVRYLGIERSELFVDYARHRLAYDTEATIIQGDVFEMLLPQSDYVLASGLMSYVLEDQSVYFNLIRKLFYASRKGLAFNMLNKRYYRQNDHLTAYLVEDVYLHCATLTRRLAIRQDYSDKDFTVYLYHV